jgi:hypothetical protein
MRAGGGKATLERRVPAGLLLPNVTLPRPVQVNSHFPFPLG